MSDQPVSDQPLSGRLGRPASPRALLPAILPSILPLAGAVLMLGLLGGCAASGTGDKMALNDSDRSAQPATKNDTIVFEFGVGLSGPTKRLSTTSSTTTLPSPENADYMRHLARQKLAETKRKSDAPYRIAEHYNAGLAASANTSEHPRILPVETVPRAIDQTPPEQRREHGAHSAENYPEAVTRFSGRCHAPSAAKGIGHKDGVIAFRAGAEQRHRRAGQLFNAADIFDRIGR